ncbi:TPA: hypothetical protein DCZ39_06980 [Patescibacteria group bacterium]|nr:hypothetical protein [Candidatus Gracilibacteria bacterium]
MISAHEDHIHPVSSTVSYKISSEVAISLEKSPSTSNCAYTVLLPVPAVSVHAVVAAKDTRGDRVELSLENCIFNIQAPEIFKITSTPVVEAASSLMTNDPESASKAHRLAWSVGMTT